MEEAERVVTTTPYKYQDDEDVIQFIEMCKRFPWQSYYS